MSLKLANNATSRLAASINTSATSISVSSGDGAKYPTIADPSDWFPLTILQSSGALEIVTCTARTGDLFTVMRAQEGTSAKAFTAGDRVELRLTAAAGDFLRGGHGQCQLRLDSATSIRLYPLNGNGIIINGRQYRLPQAGVAMSNAGLVASSGYAVYLWDDAGTLKLEASATMPAQNSDGVAIKSGDPTRTQVGLIWMDGSIQFRDDTLVRGVASLFNRVRKGMAQIINNASTVSNVSVPMSSSLIAVCFDGMWGSLNLAITNSLASMVGNHMSLVVDGTARVAIANLITYGATLPINGSLSLSQPLAPGLHQITPYGSTNAGTMTWNGYLIAEVIS